MRYRFFFTLLVAGLLAVVLLVELDAASRKPLPVTILFTADLYGQLRQFRCKRYGVKESKVQKAEMDIANLLFQLNEARRDVVQVQQHPAPLIFNTGDNLATARTVRFLLEFEGLAGIDFIGDVFGRFGYDLVGLGNHEFSVSPDKLRYFLQQARLKQLVFSLANIDKAPKSHPLTRHVNVTVTNERRDYFIFKRGGLRIGAFHLVPEEMEKGGLPDAVKGVEFGDPIEKAKTLVKRLREKEKVDLVVVLSHLEVDAAGEKVRKLARKVPGIDLILTNAMHEKKNASLAISTFGLDGHSVHIMGAAKYGAALSRIDLRVQRVPGKRARVVFFRPRSMPAHKGLFDRELRRELIKWEFSYCKRWGKPLGKGRFRNPKGMTHKQMTDYLLNLMRILAKTEVAFINTKALLKEPFPLKGYVTKDDLYHAFPFNETIERVTIKGAKLKSLLTEYSDLHKSGSKALRFIGVTGKEDDDEWTFKINGRTIEDKLKYQIATISYVASGQGGWLSVKPHQRTLLRSKGETPRIRSVLLEHFAKNLFRQLPKSSPLRPDDDDDDDDDKSKKTKLSLAPYRADEIPEHGRYLDVGKFVLWTFRSEFEGGVTTNFIFPNSIKTIYTQKDVLTTDFFQKYQISGRMKLRLSADTRMHLWRNQFSLHYKLDASQDWDGDTNAPKGLIFQEDNDQIRYQTEYHFRYFNAIFPGKQKWYFINPFVFYRLESEFSRGNRPDIKTDTQYFEDDNTEIFRHFEMTAKLGLSSQLTDKLEVKLGFAWRREFALDLRVKEKNAQSVNNDNNIGLSVEYELEKQQLFKIGGVPLFWESSAEYFLVVRVAAGKPSLITHDLVMENKLSMLITGNLKLSLGATIYLYRGLYRSDTENIRAPQEHGPIAFRIDPTISLSFNWDIRGQSY